MKIGFVYSITNYVNGNTYIGSSVDFEARKRQHLCDLRANAHHSIILQNSYNKHGEAAFMFQVIEEVEYNDIMDIRVVEQKWIDFFNPFYNILNNSINPYLGRKVTEETRIKMSKSHTGKTKRPMSFESIQKFINASSKSMKKVFKYDDDGNIIDSYKSISEAARNHSTTKQNINRAIRLNGSAKGYKWGF